MVGAALPPPVLAELVRLPGARLHLPGKMDPLLWVTRPFGAVMGCRFDVALLMGRVEALDARELSWWRACVLAHVTGGGAVVSFEGYSS